MATTSSGAERGRVAVVTGGGGGIGAAIAEELGRTGTFVVTVDPLVSVDGAERLPSPEETTAGRIVAAGGSARASAVSVTDRESITSLFADLADEFDGLDAVINVAGITRPTSFTKGSEEDWRSVLSVHLDGYRNVLDAALPIMAATGYGRVLGVTSGSGWRAADTGAYGCAKRAVASLTWQLGRHAPPGVLVNAISPIAMTRMVAAALARHRPAGSTDSGPSATGGLALGSMPSPEQLGPLAAHLVSESFTACQGQVLFAAGSEMAVVDQPRLLEVMGVGSSLARVLEAVTPGALVPAELDQVSHGGSNPRFDATLGAQRGWEPPAPAVGSCVVVSDRPELGDAVAGALEARGVRSARIDADGVGFGFGAAAGALAAAGCDGVVVALAGGRPATGGSRWERVLAEHDAVVDQIHTDAGWARAVADRSERTGTPMRLVTLTDATTAGGRSRAQASAQLARSARGATDDRVAAFAVSVEGASAHGDRPTGELAAHLVCSPEATPLSGAELVVADGSIGLRSHPRVSAGIVLGGSEVPVWLDDALGSIAR